MLKDSLHTLTANVVAQVIGLISFLLLPNALSVEHYAVTVYVGVLLFYGGFVDMGLTYVYGRKAPAMFSSGRIDEAVMLEDSVQAFFQITTFVYALAACVVFYWKFGLFWSTAMLFLVINMTPLAAFQLSKKTARGGFETYKNMSIAQSMTRLISLVGAYVMALGGWLFGTIVGLAAFFIYIRDKRAYTIDIKVKPFLCLRHISEGVVLAMLAMLWGTLLM